MILYFVVFHCVGCWDISILSLKVPCFTEFRTQRFTRVRVREWGHRRSLNSLKSGPRNGAKWLVVGVRMLQPESKVVGK